MRELAQLLEDQENEIQRLRQENAKLEQVRDLVK